MDNKPLSKHLNTRVGIIVFLVIIELICAVVLENSAHKDGETYVLIYSYVAFVFPVLFGLWFLALLADTIVLAFKRKTYLRNINLIIILFTVVLLFMVLAFFSKK
ncbi:hypothetical protein [Pedobacter sp. UYP1]|uniref:hypothetical protein n=1 Tax=Pedobacter sp. UYP1 TaxID=1756396 RepID=UPI0033944612